MRAIKFIPLKTDRTPKPWKVNLPPSVSPTGKKTARFFKSKDDAEKFCIPLREKVRAGQIDHTLPKDKTIIAEKSFELLKDYPVETLIEAARDFLARHDVQTRSVTFEEACKQFAEARTHRASVYIKNFLRYPKRFSWGKKLMCQITKADIEGELAPLTPHSRGTIHTHLCTLWNFSISQDWVVSNPFDKIQKPHTPRKPIIHPPVAQIEALFELAVKHCPRLIPYLTIETFIGVRPEESEKITWQDIDFADRILTIPESVSKTKRVRHIEIHPTGLQWLQWNLQNGGSNEGLLYQMSKSTIVRDLRKIRRLAGLNPWHQDCLRKLFASSALASGWRDVSGLCLDMGHSNPSTLARWYYRSMKKQDADALFAICPPTTENKIIRLHA